MEGFAGAVVFGLLGAALWRFLVRPTLPTNLERYDGRGLLFAFVLGYMASGLTSAAVLHFAGLPEPADIAAEPPAVPFAPMIRVITLGNAAAIFLLVMLAWRQPAARLPLGLEPSSARAPFLTAFAAYLMVVPLMGGLAFLSESLLGPLLAPEGGEPIQTLVKSLQLSDGEPTLSTWLAVCILIPFAEELLFRGALFGGLRWRLGFWPALLISSALFAMLHEDARFFLPLMGLGAVLAWLRERTGSLTAPVLLHALNNANAIAAAVAPQ